MRIVYLTLNQESQRNSPVWPGEQSGATSIRNAAVSSTKGDLLITSSSRNAPHVL